MPTETNLPTQPAQPTVDNQPFWDGLAQDRVVLPQCTGCDHVIWYPRLHCPACGSGRDAITWIETSGRGNVYSFSVTRRTRGPWAEVVPYVVAYVELDEGPRVLTNIVDCDPDSMTIGLPVQAVFHAVPVEKRQDGGATVLLRFAPQ